LISFEDGRPYRTLKRHLSTRGLTPAAYKAKWGLPGDYPTTAPSYAQMRSRMAKAIGLGQAGRQTAKAAKGKGRTKPARKT
jgi:predicted transcriptional regulator